MRYVPISKQQRDEMNRTGKVPLDVLAMTDGCGVGQALTPEQKAQQREVLEKKRQEEGSQQDRMRRIRNLISTAYFLGYNEAQEQRERDDPEKPPETYADGLRKMWEVIESRGLLDYLE